MTSKFNKRSRFSFVTVFESAQAVKRVRQNGCKKNTIKLTIKFYKSSEPSR